MFSGILHKNNDLCLVKRNLMSCVKWKVRSHVSVQPHKLTRDFTFQFLLPKKVRLGSDWLKVNGYTFRGSNSVIFIFVYHFSRSQLLKKWICSHWSKFFPLRVDPISGGLHPSGKQTGSDKNCLSLKKWQKKMEVCHYTLRCLCMLHQTYTVAPHFHSILAKISHEEPQHSFCGEFK